MDSFEIFDNVKAEKRNAMLKYRRVRNIRILFRFFEVCLALIFLSWFSTRLPDVVKISGVYFKDISVFIVSPRFVFLIGNAIILTLFAKSGRQTPLNTPTGTDLLYDEYIKNNNNNNNNGQKIGSENENDFSTSSTTQEPPQEEEIEVEDKEIDYKEIHTTTSPVIKKSVQRSQSVNVNESEKYGRQLRRTETDICRRNVVEIPEKKKSFADDDDDDQEMSNEEFQRKIEAFIAKQMRFHKEESMAIVLQNQSREEPVIIRSIKGN